jgi:protein involved in polysaccharide export with SLBB domain
MSPRFRDAAVFLIFAFASAPASVPAQTSPVAGPAVEKRQFETREQLRSLMQSAEAAHRTGEAWLLKTRLERGDFQEGDRIVLFIQNLKLAASDTITVRAGKTVQLPGIPDFSLEGVLRSELTEKLTAHVARYLHEPTVRATPLLRITVLGRVNRPGFYYAAADALLSDVIMASGGPAVDADLKSIVIRRGPDTIWQGADTRTAITDGLSLDRLHLRAGDEIEVGGRRQLNWRTALTALSGLAALFVTIMQVR